MKKLFLALLVGLSVWPNFTLLAESPSPRVAQLDFYHIKDLLEEVVLLNTQHSELKEQYTAAKLKEEAAMESFMKKTSEATSPQEIGKLIGDVNFEDHLEKSKLDNDMRKLVRVELPKLLEEAFGNNYELIVESGPISNPVLLSKTNIADITLDFKSFLLKKKAAGSQAAK